MGMSASQGRLLALTARMHDIELRAQYLQSQKLSLATQQDAAYQKYCDALDATKIQVGRTDATALGSIYYVDANFNSVMGFHPENLIQYSMINNLNGKVIVTQEIADAYETYGSDNYTFAWAMMGFESQFQWGSTGPYAGKPSGQLVGINNGAIHNYNHPSTGSTYMVSGQSPGGTTYYAGYNNDGYMTEAEFIVFLEVIDGDQDLQEAYEALLEASGCDRSTPNNPGTPASVSDRTELLNEFRSMLYDKYGTQILEAMIENKNYSYPGVGNIPTGIDIPSDFVDYSACESLWKNNNSTFKKQFDYYVNLCQQIRDAGGCEVISSQYAGGANGTEWFNNMVTSGLASLFVLRGDEWESTTIATSVGNNYLQEVNDEQKAKKAEVEYEHELDLINRKDTKFDLQLKKLETEENACKTELDELKKVKDDNIERTFNLFS